MVIVKVVLLDGEYRKTPFIPLLLLNQYIVSDVTPWDFPFITVVVVAVVVTVVRIVVVIGVWLYG